MSMRTFKLTILVLLLLPLLQANGYVFADSLTSSELYEGQEYTLTTSADSTTSKLPFLEYIILPEPLVLVSGDCVQQNICVVASFPYTAHNTIKVGRSGCSRVVTISFRALGRIVDEIHARYNAIQPCAYQYLPIVE